MFPSYISKHGSFYSLYYLGSEMSNYYHHLSTCAPTSSLEVVYVPRLCSAGPKLGKLERTACRMYPGTCPQYEQMYLEVQSSVGTSRSCTYFSVPNNGVDRTRYLTRRCNDREGENPRESGVKCMSPTNID